MNKLRKAVTYVIVALLSSALTLALYQYKLNQAGVRNFAIPSTVDSEEISKLEQLESIIDQCFVEDVDTIGLEDAAAAAMVAATGDRWSYYVPAADYAAFVEQNENAYVGIGITIEPCEEPAGFKVVQVTAGGPAEAAGIRAGDVMVSVDGQSCTEIGQVETRNLVRGKEGTTVQITMNRAGEEISFTVERRRIEVDVATYKLLDSGYGLITIANFETKCADETIAAIEALMDQNVKGIIFDVRFNPGGYKHELVEVLDYILPEGDLFHSETFDGRTETDTSDKSHIEIPMAVLVNGDSYSAAEFFAAALQEYDYAEVVGQQTCGKGYYQNTFRLNDGSAVNISTGKYYTPKGVSLAGVGITPDVPVEVDEETYAAIYAGKLSPEEDPQIQAAISTLNSAE